MHGPKDANPTRNKKGIRENTYIRKKTNIIIEKENTNLERKCKIKDWNVDLVNVQKVCAYKYLYSQKR